MKWKNDKLPGVSIGGQYYPAVDGVIDVPDNISGLDQYGYERVAKVELNEDLKDVSNNTGGSKNLARSRS